MRADNYLTLCANLKYVVTNVNKSPIA